MQQPGLSRRERRLAKKLERTLDPSAEEKPLATPDDEPAGGDSEAQEEEKEDQPEDSWVIAGNILRRIHSRPRLRQFRPDEVECPVPLKYLDVHRKTSTDLSDKSESAIKDYWNETSKDLSSHWVGHTDLYLLRPAPPKGMKWVGGRFTKVQKTTRPDDVWPEVWPMMSKKTQQQEIKRWEKESAEFTKQLQFGVQLAAEYRILHIKYRTFSTGGSD